MLAIYKTIYSHIPVNIEKPTNSQFKFILDILKQVSNVREALKKITDPECILRKPEKPSWFGRDDNHPRAEIDAIYCQYLKYTGKLPPTFKDLQDFVNRNLDYDYDISSGNAYYDKFVNAASNENSSSNELYDVKRLKNIALRLHGNILPRIPDDIFKQVILPKLRPSDKLSLMSVNYTSSVKLNYLNYTPKFKLELSKARKSILNCSSAEIDELIRDIDSKECEIIELNLSNIQTNIYHAHSNIIIKPGFIGISLLQHKNLQLALDKNTSVKILHLNNSDVSCFLQAPKSVTHLYNQNNGIGPDYMAFNNHTEDTFSKDSDRQSSSDHQSKNFNELYPNLKYLDLSHTGPMNCTDWALDILAKTNLECLIIKGFIVHTADSTYNLTDRKYIEPEEAKLPKYTKLKIIYI